MKKKKNKGALHLMLALCTMGSLAACSSDDVLSNIKETDDAVKIAVSTRSGETGTTENPWIVNDTIALSAIDYQTGTYQWNGNTWSSDSILYWPKGQTKCNFMGYYPTTATNDGLSFTIPTDQSDAAKLHAADYMTTDLYYAEKSTDPAKQLIDFNFRHRLAKVVINITYTSEYDAGAPSLSNEKIFSQGSGVTVIKNEDNNETSSVVSTGYTVSIQPKKGTNAEGKPCYTALVSPTTLTKGNTLMFINVNGNILHSIFTGADLKLESGKAYNFNVAISRDKVEIGGVTVTGWNEGGVSNSVNASYSLEQLLTDEYKAIRERMTTLTVYGPTLYPNIQPNCFGENFSKYFPNVTTLNITGTTIPYPVDYGMIGILNGNSTVKTIIGNDITSLPDDAFYSANGVTSYTFPNLTEAGEWCFGFSASLKEISLPKLKALSQKLFFDTSLDKACFASLTDFSNVGETFRGVSHLALGFKEEFTFGDKTPAAMFALGDESAANTTLYLDENGFEYKNHRSKEDSTIWRGTKFKEIRKYNEYPGKKD